MIEARQVIAFLLLIVVPISILGSLSYYSIAVTQSYNHAKELNLNYSDHILNLTNRPPVIIQNHTLLEVPTDNITFVQNHSRSSADTILLQKYSSEVRYLEGLLNKINQSHIEQLEINISRTEDQLEYCNATLNGILEAIP